MTVRPGAEFWWREDLLDWSVLYWLLMPFVLAGAGIRVLWNRIRRRR